MAKTTSKSVNSPGRFNTIGMQTFKVKSESALDSIASNKLEEQDPFINIYGESSLIEPPYRFSSLYRIYEESDVLRACVAAMQKNVDGFGYRLDFLGDDISEKNSAEAQIQFENITQFFDEPNKEHPFRTIRTEMRKDFEVLGQAAMEVVRFKSGGMSAVYYLPMIDLRVSVMDAEPITIQTTLWREGRLKKVNVRKRFRKFAQVMNSGWSTTQGGTVRWFKQLGDPRIMDATTGKYVSSRKEAVEVATEVLLIQQPTNGRTYAVPRWIANVTDIKGRANAQYINYDIGESQGIPPMMLLVQNGMLSDESKEQLRTWAESMRGPENFSRIALLEAVPEIHGIDDKGNVQIKLENLTDSRSQDLMFGGYLDKTMQAVRQAFRIPSLYLGDMGDASYACHSEDTEVLTREGWKLFPSISLDDEIATILPNTHAVEFHAPSRVYSYEVQNEMMIRFKTAGGIDVLVTRNHDMYNSPVSNPHSVMTEWRKQKAVSLLGKKTRFLMAPTTCKDDNDIHFIKLDNGRFVSLEALAPLVTALVVDGHLPKEVSRRKEIFFNVKKQRKVDYISSVVRPVAEELGARWDSVSYPSNKDKVTIKLFSKSLINWLNKNIFVIPRELTPGKLLCSNKKLPDFFINLPYPYLQLIFEAMCQTDGHTYNDTYWVYTSTSKTLIDQLQIICFKLGYKTSFRKFEKNLERNKQTYYVLNIHNKKYEEIKKADIFFEKYTGRVYCVEIPNHLFVTRRNSRIGIHGNSSYVMQKVSEEQVFVPERQAFDDIINTHIIKGELKSNLWKYVTLGPQIVSSEELRLSLKEFSSSGAITANNAIDLLNDMFGLNISKYDADWANFPVVLLKTMANNQTFVLPELANSTPPTKTSSKAPTNDVGAPSSTSEPMAPPVKSPSQKAS